MVKRFRGIRVPFNEAGMGKARRRYSQGKPAAARENFQGLHTVMLDDTGGLVNKSPAGCCGLLVFMVNCLSSGGKRPIFPGKWLIRRGK